MEDRGINCVPIGYVHSPHAEKYMAPKQASLGQGKHEGIIRLNAECNFEQALDDLAGFDRIWLIYWLHRNSGWKPKVLPPKQTQKRGLFSTRSPHRPNPLGLSCVELIRVSKRELHIGKHDLLDGTPILDIKPYLPYADAFPGSRCGWAENTKIELHQIDWAEKAWQQAVFIESHTDLNFVSTVEQRLQDDPYPFPNRRIKQIGKTNYELAFKTWRVLYSIRLEVVYIQEVRSGYDMDTLQGKKSTRWNDLQVHLDFFKRFKNAANI